MFKAFFKSVSGQLEVLQQNWPFVSFDGISETCKCNPIAETDLATYILNCVDDQSKWNKILNIGGPDEGMTMKQQGKLIFDVTLMNIYVNVQTTILIRSFAGYRKRPQILNCANCTV